MFGSDVLEVGIGLTLLFLLASLICSAVVEMIEGLLKARAMHMERGLRELLQDPDGVLAAKLFQHPLIYNLYSGSYDPGQLTAGTLGPKRIRWSARGSLPSYIPAASFARAVIDFVGRGEELNAGYNSSPLTVAQLRYRVATLAHPALQRAFASALDGAENDLAQVQKNLEAWFDTTMDRVSGWYKRRSGYFLFFVGLIAAVLLNLDPIAIGSKLTTDDALRERFLAEAQLLTQASPGGAGQRPAGGPPLTADQSTSAPSDADIAATLRSSREQIQSLRTQLDNLSAPTGWKDGYPIQACKPPLPGTPLTPICTPNNGAWPGIILGWLITALAVTLGAPFWFDLLNRFMIVRSTIKPHEKSPEEPPIDAERNRAPSAPTPAPSQSPGAGAAGTAGAAAAIAGRTESPPLPPEEDLDAPRAPPAMIPANQEVLI